MSNDSQESPMSSRHRFYPSVLTQMQIERLKREDDEEHWISGEELYTEGSSEDEEDQRLIVIRDPEFIENEDNICPNVTIGGERERLAISPTICSRLKSNRKNHGVLRPRSIPVRDRNIAAEAEERVRVDNESDSVASGSSSSSAVMAAAIVSSVEDEEISSISSCKETSSAVMGTNQCAENRGENFSAVTAEHAGDGEEDGEEISWRPKRDSIAELRELQFEYNEILDSLSDLKRSLANEPSNCTGISSSNSENSSDNSRLLNDNNDHGDENENIGDSRLPITSPDESTILTQQLRNNGEKNSPATAAAERTVNEEIIIIEDVNSFSDDCLQDVESWSNAIINTAKIKKEMVKMMKLDMCIEELDQKVKKAREETFREQIANRRELKKLQQQTLISSAPESASLAKNSEQFYKLCSTMQIESAEGNKRAPSKIHIGEDISSGYTSVPPIILPSQNDGLEKSRKDDEDDSISEEDEPDVEKESRESRREKLEEELKIIDKRKASFIKRNKELASLYAVHGNLAITDEEKNRLERLMEDINDEQFENNENYSHSDICSSTAAASTPYKFDEEADELLKNLTEQLENMNSETYRKAVAEQSENSTREEFLPHKEQVVLNSLRNLAESNSEIIHPISEEEIRGLIDEYYAERGASSSRISENDFPTKFSNNKNDNGDLGLEVLEDSESNSNSFDGESLRISQEIINDLIDEAKATMPLFQFKYHHKSKSIEEIGDNSNIEY